jgi:hypothetical protein
VFLVLEALYDFLGVTILLALTGVFLIELTGDYLY